MDPSSQTLPNAAAAVSWIYFALILKTSLLLITLASLRAKNKSPRAPEDNAYHGNDSNTPVNPPTDEYSTMGRIGKCLANDLEYTPYFMLLCLLCCFVPTYQVQRLIIYGSIFVFARYLHTWAYITGHTMPRFTAFFISFLTNLAFSLDLLIVLNKNSTWDN